MQTISVISSILFSFSVVWLHATLFVKYTILIFFSALAGVRVGVSHPAVSAGRGEACSHFCDAVAGM